MPDYDDEEAELIRKHRAAKAKKREEEDNKEVRIWHRDSDGKEYETGMTLAKAKGFLKNFPGLNLDEEEVQDEDDAKDGDAKDAKAEDGEPKKVVRFGRRYG